MENRPKPDEKFIPTTTPASTIPVFVSDTQNASIPIGSRPPQLAVTPPLTSYHEWTNDKQHRQPLLNPNIDKSSSSHSSTVNQINNPTVIFPSNIASGVSRANAVTQAFAAGLVNTNHPGFPSTNNPTCGQSSQQFQKLKVEDALSYLDQVKYQFGNQPQVYNDFLDIMKEFKSQSIDTPGVIQRVSHLFNGHPDLIVGFNTFLPPGYKIEVSGNDQISVTGPNMLSQNITQIGTLPIQHQVQVHTPNGVKILPISAPISGPISAPISGPIVQPPSPVSQPVQPAAVTPVISSFTSRPPLQAPTTTASISNTSQPTPVTSAPLTSPNTTPPPTVIHSIATLQSGAVIASRQTASPRPSNGTTTPNSAAQPVEFNHAINYVNKIKNRFQGQPDIYKSFLDILHKYQKEQKNIKDSNGTYTPTLSESEVYSQVARLFQRDDDLLREFGQFLPDANGNFGAVSSISSVATPQLQATTPPQKAPHSSEPEKSVEAPTRTKRVTSSDVTNAKSNRSLSTLAQQSSSNKRYGAVHTAHIPNPKRARSSVLKDVTFAEASKVGTLQEFGFFDKVRNALDSQQAYETFLRCILLYNLEIIGRTELVFLAQTYLSKWKNLFSWFKEFLGLKDTSSGDMTSPTQLQHQLKEKHEGMAMEIDYTSLQRLGFSYRALPESYQQPKCSGRDDLCREVLNDRWVSFPTFSEDSTFVNSKKTLFEEHIYRCEDERYEMDMVLEINLAAQKFLDYLNKKLQKLSHEELSRFRLESQLTQECSSTRSIHDISETTFKKALRRIYGEVASTEIYTRLKQDPKIAVPFVLKRIKAKDEEWRSHQQGFNRHWRSQSEKYHLKALDHQAPGFKQADVKYMRSKTLISELEGLYDERQQAIDTGSTLAPHSGPHLRVTYEDKSAMDDAASLIIHHVKRQAAINHDDKEKIRKIVYQFLPDLFFAPRGNQASDDDDEDSSTDEDGEKNGFFKANQTSFTGYTSSDNMEGHYHLFMGNNHFYLFFRLHHLLCERLSTISRENDKMIQESENENKSKIGREIAEIFKLPVKTSSASKVDYYASFLDNTRDLLDGKMDSNVFEDKVREKFTIHAYITFTIDKLIINIVRQLQHIVTDDTCVLLLELYKTEEENKATGGLLASQQRRQQIEAFYQRKAEHITASNNCIKILASQMKGVLNLAVELVDTDERDNLQTNEYSKWSDYLEKYADCEEHDVSDGVRERLEEKPVFLQRNANHLRAVARNRDEDENDLEISEKLEFSFKPANYSIKYVPNTEDILFRRHRFTSKLLWVSFFHFLISKLTFFVI